LNRLAAVLLAPVLALAAGCAGDLQEPEGRIRAFVSIPPLAYFVERIGGEHVEVDVLVGPGQSPHSYEPTPRQMAKLSRAQVYFAAGLPFEKTLIPKIKGSNKRLMIAGLYEDPGRDAEDEHSDKGAEHGHEHSGKDPHAWLDPGFARDVIAARIAAALAELDREHSEYYGSNARSLREELDRLSLRISRAVARAGRREFYVFHPAFGHFAQAYGLTQVAIEEHGKEPGAKQLAGLIEKAKEAHVEVIFTQPQFAKGSAEAVARAIGARIETLDPLAKDYMKNLEETARKVTAAIGGQWPREEEGADSGR
jgi:zinc transport system substrate-binding protein